jgi:hypothetical protein
MLRSFVLAVGFSAVSLGALGAAPKPVPVCKVTFQVIYLDRLKNTNVGIPPESLKDIDKRLSKFGDVCHADGKATGDLVFFIHTSPAVYHGTKVYTNSSSAAAAATDGNGGAAAAASSSTSTTSVPYSVDYSVFVMDIELMQPDGSFKVLHTFDQKGLYNTIYGIGYGKGKHPIPNVIEAGAKWVHDEYLGSQTKTKW